MDASECTMANAPTASINGTRTPASAPNLLHFSFALAIASVARVARIGRFREGLVDGPWGGALGPRFTGSVGLMREGERERERERALPSR